MTNRKKWIIGVILALILPGGFIAAGLIGIKKVLEKIDFRFNEEDEEF